MRVWQFLLVLLLLVPLLDAQKNTKNKNKGNKNKGNNQNREDGGEEGPDDMVDNEDRDRDDDDRDNNNTNMQLPRNTLLMEDRDVERGPMWRMSKGHGCRVTCKGWVSGMTEQDSRTAYYKYVNVDVTGCYDRETVYPSQAREHHDWHDWNATVTQLQFYKPKDSNVRKIPKRLSMPTEVRGSQPQCDDDSEDCQYDQRSFGFVVYVPRFDMQVRWRVEWEVTAHNPYMNYDDDNQGNWNYQDCDDMEQEYTAEERYEKNAFSVDWEDGYAFWKPVRGNWGDNNRNYRMDRMDRDNRNDCNDRNDCNERNNDQRRDHDGQRRDY